MGEEFKEMTSFMRKTACRAEATRRRIYRAAAWRRRKQGINENEALEKGLKEKANEWSRAGMRRHRRAGPRGRERGQRLSQFAEKGAEVYAKT